jgi:hypothetical protein
MKYANKSFIIFLLGIFPSEVTMGLPQAYGVVHYLDDSLLDDHSFPVKKLHHKTISHLFSRMDDIRGHKDNMCC